MKELYRNILDQVNKRTEASFDRKLNDRVLIIDGMNTFIRSWTVTPTMNEDGDHVGGVTGTLKSIAYAIREVNPTRVVVVFDGKNGSQKRRKKFKDYKKGRSKAKFNPNRQYPEMMNEEEEEVSMRRQLLWLVDVIDHLPITTMIYEGIEADDVIAYISRHCLTEGQQSIIMSTDKDFLQLVDDHTIIWSPTEKKLYNRERVVEKFNIYPKNLLVYRAMDGDKSDNIPGVKGIGIKTVLKRFPVLGEELDVTMQDILDIAEENKEKYKIYEKVSKSKDQLLLNEDLMQLEDPEIGTHNRLNITNRFNESIPPLSKFDFFKVGTKYKLLQNWGNPNGWLNESFGTLIYE